MPLKNTDKNNRLIKPGRLLPGARIGVVSPACWLEADKQEKAAKALSDLGYEVILGSSTHLRQNQYAGTPEERAADLHRMFADPAIDAILCSRGGYGSNRVLPLLDYALIRANPKIFMGFSDITGILASLAQHAGLVGFHGPMLYSFSKEVVPYNLETLQTVLSGQDDLIIRSSESCQARILKPGVASGPLWGGNLILVCERLGTRNQINTRGAILFLEEIDEKLYAFDRLMLQLKNSGSLDGIKGLIIGEMIEIGDSKVPFGKTIDEIVLDVCQGLDIPVISNFPCGHGRCQATLPISHPIELHADGDDPFLRIPESPVV
ncbi:MAG: LD-carboxypeptidase [Gammaproteobacteria bacterium]|nr:LD-carboxypeptidase [Gammaproteobacteria bacterium]